jgi:hypothetical protein
MLIIYPQGKLAEVAETFKAAQSKPDGRAWPMNDRLRTEILGLAACSPFTVCCS